MRRQSPSTKNRRSEPDKEDKIRARLREVEAGDLEELRKNMAECRPAVMSSVPCLWEKLYIQISGLVAQRPPAVQRLFRWALAVGKDHEELVGNDSGG